MLINAKISCLVTHFNRWRMGFNIMSKQNALLYGSRVTKCVSEFACFIRCSWNFVQYRCEFVVDTDNYQYRYYTFIFFCPSSFGSLSPVLMLELTIPPCLRASCLPSGLYNNTSGNLYGYFLDTFCFHLLQQFLIS